MARVETAFICASCGQREAKWSGKCSSCGAWNSLVEAAVPASSQRTKSARPLAPVQPEALSAVDLVAHGRIKTGLGEVDQVLGGGLVPGSALLLAGDPGIGKSTLVLQLAAETAKTKHVLYASGEESAAQIKLRAERLGLGQAALDLLAETSVEAITALLQTQHYDLVIIDSIQTMATEVLPGAAGSVAQVAASAQVLIAAAKQLSSAVLMIGHVTKEGSIAGPKTLEHLVDVVLYLEGERYGSFKALRGVKNRFGSTNEVGIFEMTDAGLAEVANPSAALLAERQSAPGSVVLCTMEGTRPLLVEAQALVVPSVFGYPKRTANGVDLNRLQLLVAVLIKRAGLNLSSADVYVNIVGGLKVTEPACDLAIILSIVSALKGIRLDSKLAVFGEVGLAGELRTVARGEARLAEARKLGFTRVLGPRTTKPNSAALVPAANVREAIELGLQS